MRKRGAMKVQGVIEGGRKQVRRQRVRGGARKPRRQVGQGQMGSRRQGDVGQMGRTARTQEKEKSPRCKPDPRVALTTPIFWPHSQPWGSGGLTSAGGLWGVRTGPVEAPKAGANGGSRVRSVTAGRAR